MRNFIGDNLENVVNYCNKNGIPYTIINNNHNIIGDTKLVTNIIAKDDTVEITVGEFIFDLRNKNHDK